MINKPRFKMTVRIFVAIIFTLGISLSLSSEAAVLSRPISEPETPTSLPITQTVTYDFIRSSPVIANIDYSFSGYEAVVGSLDGKVYAWHHDGTYIPGWPVATGGSIQSSPAIADLDGDNKPDVVVGSNDGYIYAFGNGGSLLWKYQTGGPVISSPVIAELYDDPSHPGPEIVVGSSDGNVYALYADGTSMQGFWPYETGGPVISSPAIAELCSLMPGPEIVIGSNDNKIHVITSFGISTGGVCGYWPYQTGGPVISSPAIASIDGDTIPEIVVGSDDGKVYALYANGTLYWEKLTGGPVRTRAAIAELDFSYACLEMVIGSDDGKVYVWHGDKSPYLEFTTGGPVTSSASIYDLSNGTQVPDNFEIVIGSQDGKVYAWHHDGTFLWSYNTNAPIYSSPAVYPFGSYKGAAVVVNSGDAYYDGKVYALHGVGDDANRLIPGWPRTIYDLPISTPAIADLDPSQPGLERIVGSQDGHVYTFKADGNPLGGYWPVWVGAPVVTSPNVAQVDPTREELDVVISSGDGNLYVFRPDGQLYWKESIGDPATPYSSPAIGELDSNYAGSEIVVGSTTGNYVYAFKSSGGTPLWQRPVSGRVISSPTIADLDRDGDFEVLVCTGSAYVYALEGKTGNDFLPDWPVHSDGFTVPTHLTVADLDGNKANGLEVAVGASNYAYPSMKGKVYAWHYKDFKGDDGKADPVDGWPQEVGGARVSAPVMGDIDKDGINEIIAGSSDGKVYAWYKTGNPVVGWPVDSEDTSGAEPSSLAIADLDSDSANTGLEVVICYGSQIYAWHHADFDHDGKVDRFIIDGSPKVASSTGSGDTGTESITESIMSSASVNVIPIYSDSGVESMLGAQQSTSETELSAASIADLGGKTGFDRHLEIVVSSVSNLYTFTLSSTTSDQSPWPKDRHDEMNTAAYTLAFLRGNVDGNDKVTVSDVVYLVNYLFKGGPDIIVDPNNSMPDYEERYFRADVNIDSKINVGDIVYLVNYLFKGGCPPGEPNCNLVAAAAIPSGGTASVGLSSVTTLSDGTERVYYNVSLSTAAAGFSIDLITYDPAFVKLKAVYTTANTQGFDILLNDDLKGNLIIGVLKPDGSKLIAAGSGNLLDLRFIGTNLSSIRLIGASFADQYGLPMGVSIFQATVPSSLIPYTPPTKTITAPLITETEVTPTLKSSIVVVPSTTTPVITTAPIITQTETLSKEPVKEIVSPQNELVAITPALDFSATLQAEKVPAAISASTPEIEIATIPKPPEAKEVQAVPKTLTDKLLTIPTERAKLLYFALADPGVVQRVSKNPITQVNPKDKPVVVFQVGNKFFQYQQSQFKVITTRFPKATYRISEKGLLVVYQKNKPVACLLAVKMSNKPLLAEEAKKLGLYKPEK